MSQYITNITENKRNQFKKMLDQFSTFTWNGLEGFQNFGAFIINENREGLKFYNGPSFSNEYTSPQFAKNKEFIGVNFEQQKISFKIGVYWISIEDYRKFLEWLNPYVISNLSFTFNSQWYYLAKLTGREDSTRYILGYETTEHGPEPRYYSELTLNFEVQGEPCLYSHSEFMWIRESSAIGENDTTTNTYKISTNTTFAPSISDLPVDLTMNLCLCATASTGSLIARISYGNTSKQLFNLQLKNLTIKDTSQTGETPNDPNAPYAINIEYSSKDGLLYLAFGGEKYKLLNLLTTTTSGKEMVDSLNVNKIQLPGKFISKDIDYSNFSISLEIRGLTLIDNYIHKPIFEDIDKDEELDDNEIDTAIDRTMDIQIHSRARTNII